jgi:hypothetical protein
MGRFPMKRLRPALSCIAAIALIHIRVFKISNTICFPPPQFFPHRRAALSTISKGIQSVYSIAEITGKAVYNVICLWRGANPRRNSKCAKLSNVCCVQSPDRRTNFQPGPGPKPGPEPGPVLLLCTVQVHPTKIGS